MTSTAEFYSKPSYHFRGGGFPVFSVSRRQRGGGILGALKQMIVPTLAKVGKSVGRAALKQAVGFASDVLDDSLQGKNLGQSLRTRGKQRALSVAQTAKKQSLNALRNTVRSTNQPSRKRQASKQRQPKKKRQRANQSLF